MIIDIDHDRFAAAGLACKIDEHGAMFHLLDDTGGEAEHWSARVALEGGKLSFYPQRSSGQRMVLARLGIAVTEPSFA